MRATILPYAIPHTDQGPKAHMAKGMYCGLSNASEVFLFFTTQLYQYLMCFFLFALFSDRPEIFLPKFLLPNSNTSCCSLPEGSKLACFNPTIVKIQFILVRLRNRLGEGYHL